MEKNYLVVEYTFWEDSFAISEFTKPFLTTKKGIKALKKNRKIRSYNFGEFNEDNLKDLIKAVLSYDDDDLFPNSLNTTYEEFETFLKTHKNYYNFSITYCKKKSEYLIYKKEKNKFIYYTTLRKYEPIPYKKIKKEIKKIFKELK